MKARDVFGIVIRSIGIVILILGVWYLAFGVAQACGVPQDTPGEMANYFVSGLPSCLLAVVFLRCARQIVRFSYPGDREDSDSAA